MSSKDRAVCVCFDQGNVLVMRRHKDGRDYSVLPGGGVEEGEEASCAAIRELQEETGLSGRVVRHLATIDHPDRTAHYFLLDVVPGSMSVGGPEAEAQSPNNRYSPEWVPLSALEREPIVPEDVRSVIYAARV
ncbi:MAG TPA: NUDIX domain-containing protein [Trebonia sp.]|jgi:8-oxo-dGTP diphosphatase|nr:NUDIX domain-containing protein [Trebonia sp.]